MQTPSPTFEYRSPTSVGGGVGSDVGGVGAGVKPDAGSVGAGVDAGAGAHGVAWQPFV